MSTVKFHYSYPINFVIPTDKEVDVYIDQFPMEPLSNGNMRIVVLEEPAKTEVYKLVQIYQDHYTHLLTFHEELLDRVKKAQLFHFPNSWVRGYLPTQKYFSVSTIVGGKRMKGMEGHLLRHRVWNARFSIHNIPRAFYLSGSAKHAHRFVRWRQVSYKGELVLGASKAPLFDSMFHIAIENTSIKNYFSEKLLDCFQTKTIPIYYGCKNIEKYFNVDGMFIVWGLEDIISICNQLTPDTYKKMLPAVEDNYKQSMKWAESWEPLKNKIISLIQ